MVEPGDAERAETRLGFLEHSELDIINSSKIHKSDFDAVFQEFSHKLETLRRKAQSQKAELLNLDRMFQLAVKMLRKTASKSDLDAVDKKISAWAPDKLITKKELARLLKENR
jgi:hypothetical protein